MPKSAMPEFPARVFLDANVIFSAALSPGGNARALFKLAALRGTLLVTSRFAVEEAFRNIAVKTPQHIAEGESLLTDIAEVAEPSAAWLDVVDQTMREGGPKGPLAALVFDPEHYVATRSGRPVFLPEPDSKLLHLGHALYHRVMSVFARYRFPGGPAAATRWTARTS